MTRRLQEVISSEHTEGAHPIPAQSITRIGRQIHPPRRFEDYAMIHETKTESEAEESQHMAAVTTFSATEDPLTYQGSP